MKKLLFLFVPLMAFGILSLGLGSCKDSKKDNEVESTDSLQDDDDLDSLDADTAVVDNTPVSQAEEIIDATPMPKTADELFDDFFFNFSNSRKVQKERIKWPLEMEVNGAKKTMAENQWSMERFYADDGFYVMLLDDDKQTKLAKDTSVTSVAVKHVNIPNNSLETFSFNRIEGRWMMTLLEKESLSESRNANFLKFYQKFATDTLFCQQSLAETIKFTGPDEEDENITTTRDITAEEYGMWAPELATDFYTLSYGQKNESSNSKVFIMRQPASSQECRLYFRRQGSKWTLYRLEE